MEQYTNFIAKLYADGRMTDAEVEELKRSFEQRVPQLAPLPSPPRPISLSINGFTPTDM